MTPPLPEKLEKELNNSIKYSIDKIIKYYKDLADYKRDDVDDRKKISFTNRVLNELFTDTSKARYDRLCRPQDKACLYFADKTNQEALTVNKRAFSLWALCSRYEDHYKAICANIRNTISILVKNLKLKINKRF